MIWHVFIRMGLKLKARSVDFVSLGLWLLFKFKYVGILGPVVGIPTGVRRLRGYEYYAYYY